MEVFSLLKYWRTGGGGESFPHSHSHSQHRESSTTGTGTNTGSYTSSSVSATSTIATVVDGSSSGGDCGGEESDRDDGPFFDLEFTVPVPEEELLEEECEEEDEDEFDFAVDSSCSTGNRTDPHLSLSPSDDLFFNGSFVPLEPAEFGFSSAESSSKLGSLLKPATKLRVLMLGFKKPKPVEKTEKPEKQTRPKASFTVKLKVEEDPVTILSLFGRDGSSKNPNTSKMNKDETDCVKETVAAVAAVGSDERKFTKDVLQKYLKMVKPLYFKVSKKSNGFSGQLNNTTPSATISPEGEPAAKGLKEGANLGNVRGSKEGNLTAGLRNVRKHLGKSRSASSAAVASVPPAAAASIQSRRHDDSLLQQQDGIQSAIMHCKRSFTASRDSESNNSSALSRCTSDPSHEKSKSTSITKAANSSRISLDETRTTK